MKRLLFASVLLGAAATIGAANAVPLTATGLGVWSGDTPGDTATSTRQQALPGTRALLPLVSATPLGAASGPINLNVPAGGTNTVGTFLASGPVVSAGCAAGCQANTLSLVNFAHATLFEFTFTVGSSGTLTVTHDDGISLFNATDTTFATNLIPGQSAPTFAQLGTANLTAGSYVLFYESNNGLPETLLTNFVAAVPEPASLTLLGSALLGLGWLSRRRRKNA